MEVASKRSRAALIKAKTGEQISMPGAGAISVGSTAGAESSAGGGEASTRDGEQGEEVTERFVGERRELIGDLL